MNIYLVERTDKWSYDDHIAFVVAAESEEEAKNMELGYAGTWTTPDKIKVTLIGTAAPNIEKGQILDSFNAG